MIPMRIAMVYTHHFRARPAEDYRRALLALGHEVRTAGPWNHTEPPGWPEMHRPVGSQAHTYQARMARLLNDVAADWRL